MTMCMNDICTNYNFYEKCMNDVCCGISKHIHLEEDADEVDGDPTWGRKDDNFDSSDALSDQVLSLDTAVNGRHQETRCSKSQT